MIVILLFTCQMSSSRAEMNQQTNSVTFSSKPNADLNDQEKVSCIAQSGQTALYSVTIGTNVFRSNLVIYDAFKDAEIVLKPVDGSSVSDALTFFIGSYDITFLDSNLVQSGAVGELLSTVYNLNECIHNGTVIYETFNFIKPSITVNPNCNIIPTDNVQYEFSVDSLKLLTETILKINFDFNTLTLENIDCSIGTDIEKEDCIEKSKYISRTNFIQAELILSIPKTITSENIYIDDYGVTQTVSQTLNFFLNFIVPISNRMASQVCTKLDLVCFNKDTIYISQETDKPCDLLKYPKQEFWLTTSELEDNSGKQFQLQFYSTEPFSINQFLNCDTWEISGYESPQQCQTELSQTTNYPPNASTSIAYKLFSDADDYLGAFRFSAQIVPGGQSILTVSQRQLCVKLLKNLTSERNFASIKVRISTNFNRFQQEKIDFQAENSFIFPSPDQVYCYSLTKKAENLLNEMRSDAVFGTVEVAGSLLEIESFEILIAYEVFYEGWGFLVLSVLLMVAWVGGKVILNKAKQEHVKNRMKQ